MSSLKKVLATLLLLTFGVSLAAAQPGDEATSAISAPAVSVDQVVDRFIAHEKELVDAMRHYHPMVETYYQSVRPDQELGTVPAGDRYFIGRLDLSDGLQERLYSDIQKTGFKQGLALFNPLNMFIPFKKLVSLDVMPLGFAAMIFPDSGGFDRNAYTFQFMRREFLGDVRTLVFSVTPKDKTRHGRFLGHVWVEDKDFHIVRFNGTYTNPPHWGYYFHMDSWRANVQPGMWLPSEVYSEESAVNYSVANRTLRFKAQTRLWAYDLRHAGRQEEFTQIAIDSDAPVKDESDTALDWSPVTSLRAWQREAEDNVLERMEQAGLLAAPGPVDKVLETVVNNVEITNNLDIQPEVHCRVLLTSPMESFTVGHTIVISRGLLDVLPDEASLAMVLSHELAHIVAGDQLDTKFAFGDRMLFKDENTYQNFKFQRTPGQEAAADTKGIELLRNSPYKEKLAQAGLFLKQLQKQAADLPELTRAHMGNGIVENGRVRMADLMRFGPQLQVRKLDQIAALPLGGRIKLDPWADQVDLMRTKPVQLQNIREKMPFEVAPVIPHLTRLNSQNSVASAAASNSAAGSSSAAGK